MAYIYWLIILCFAYLSVTNTERDSIKPGLHQEIYTSSKHGFNTTYFANQYIECGADICDVRCDVYGGCHNLTINGSLSSSLIIECNENQSCTELLVIAPLSDLYMYCTANEACFKSEIYSQYTSNINIECGSFHSCRGAIFEAETVTNELNIKCINDDSCYESDIHCPLDASCNINCLNTLSCQSMDFFIHNAVDNTLNMNCDNTTECNGVIHCANNYHKTSNFEQSALTKDIYCNVNNPGCCPFTESTIVCVSGSDCAVDCSNTTCTGYHIDAKNANSLSLQCGVGYGCENALIECPIANDTRCDIICNSCKKIFIKPSFNFNLSCIGVSSCDSMLLSLDGKFNQLDIECTGYRSCYYALIIHNAETHGFIDRFSMKCTGDQTCYRMKMNLQMNAGSNDTITDISDLFSLTCIGSNEVCYDLDVSLFGNIDKVHIQCGNVSKSDTESCQSGRIFHSGSVINTIDFLCYGYRAFRSSDIYLYAKDIGTFVWDCLSNEGISSYSACDRTYLELEASVDEVNITCMGYDSCYNAVFSFGSSATTNVATINRWNLRCIEDEEDRWGNGDYACIYADVYAYSGKTINYLDIECNGGNMGCLNTMTRLYGDALIHNWNMDCYNHTWNCELVYYILNDDSAISHATVNCMGDETVCYGIWFDWYTDNNSTQQFIYNCNTPNVCKGGYIDGRLQNDHVIDITLNCNAVDSCREFEINAEEIGKLNLNCNDSNACIDMSVSCPIWDENVCNIECSNDDGSCENIAITAQENHVYGYLDLKCPSPEIYDNNTACDGVTIDCGRYSSKLAVEYIYDYIMHGYTCSNISDTYCCPLNGISRNPTHDPTIPTSDPTMEPTIVPTRNPSSQQPTYNPTMEPSPDPTRPSSAPTFAPTLPTQAPNIPLLYQVAVEIEFMLDLDDIPLYLMMEIIQQTIYYVLNTTDSMDACEVTDDELSVDNTESGIKISGEIITCLDEPQIHLIEYFNHNLETEIIDNINDVTVLTITEDDIKLDVDVLNPFVPSESTPILSTTRGPNVEPISNTNKAQIRNIMIVIGCSLLFGFAFVCLYRRHKNKRKNVVKTEKNMHIELFQTSADDTDRIQTKQPTNYQETVGTVHSDENDIEFIENEDEAELPASFDDNVKKNDFGEVSETGDALYISKADNMKEGDEAESSKTDDSLYFSKDDGPETKGTTKGTNGEAMKGDEDNKNEPITLEGDKNDKTHTNTTKGLDDCR